MNEWRDIGSAPKDGTPFIGFDGERVNLFAWLSEPDDQGHTGWCEAAFDYGGVMYVYHNIAYDPPILWTPLPEPPEQNEIET